MLDNVVLAKKEENEPLNIVYRSWTDVITDIFKYGEVHSTKATDTCVKLTQEQKSKISNFLLGINTLDTIEHDIKIKYAASLRDYSFPLDKVLDSIYVDKGI